MPFNMLALNDKATSFLARSTIRRQHHRVAACAILSFISTTLIFITLIGHQNLPFSLPSFTLSSSHRWETPPPGSPPPHIPPKIWQISLPFLTPNVMTTESITSFITHSPSHSYTALDADGANALLGRVAAEHPVYTNIRALYDAIPRIVMRADFLRYLALAMEGGVYSDADTVMVRGLAHWVPEEFRDRTRLIVGIEADSGRDGDVIPGTAYRVQFCQWTLAGAVAHPVFWKMVDRILGSVVEHEADGGRSFSDRDVLEVGGPVGWTKIVYEYLSLSVGSEVTWADLTGLREPKLFGDVLVLPIDAFATGVWHSGASKVGANKDGTLVLHSFKGSWKPKKGGWWPW